jgi:hypothetical protein
MLRLPDRAPLLTQRHREELSACSAWSGLRDAATRKRAPGQFSDRARQRDHLGFAALIGLHWKWQYTGHRFAAPPARGPASIRHEHEIQPAASTAARARHGACVWARGDPARCAVGAFVCRHEGAAECLHQSAHGNHGASNIFAANCPSPADGQPDVGITGGGRTCPARCRKRPDAGNAAPQHRRQTPAAAWLRLADRTRRRGTPGASDARVDRRAAKRSV